MSNSEILPGLLDLGIDEKTARELSVGLEGGDYVNLVNALGLADPVRKIKAAAPILGKYGITISEGNGDMANSKNYLGAMFSKFREGKGDAIESEILGDWLKPISESNAPDAAYLVFEGFNYFMQLEDSQQGEGLMDWLDENKVQYITDGKGQFHIKCDDREAAYRVGKAANGLMAKKRIVRDSVDNKQAYVVHVVSEYNPNDITKMTIYPSDESQIYKHMQDAYGIPHSRIARVQTLDQNDAEVLGLDEDSFPVETTKGIVMVQGSDEFAARRNARQQGFTLVEAKSAKQREAEAKAKIADIKPRNQDLLALSQRGGKGAHKDNSRKTDALDRKAKHKKTPTDESIELSIDNQVSEDHDNLAESVLGMKALSPIFRLRELAGMAPAPLARPELDDMDLIEVDHDDSGFNDPLAAGPVGVDAEPADTPSPLSAGPVDIEDPFMAGDTEPMADAGMGDLEPMVGPAVDPIADPMAMGGVPGDLPPMGAEAVLGMPTQSEAMSHIEDCLNDIQGKLAEIRLAEYKSLVQKLTSLTQQVQTMGRDYLGEQRRKK